MKKFIKKFSAASLSAALLFGFSSCVKETENPNFPSNLEQWSGDQSYTSPIALPSLQNQSTNLEANWWKNSAFYHIWIKSFKDSDNNDCSKNCGDFKGIQDSLDYIQNDLGCDAIWLSPFWDCAYKGSTNASSASLNMHGYDVVDFYKVNPYFGTGDDATSESAEEELLSLIDACHARGMKIIFDFVPNHTSNQNQWFIDSANDSNDKSSWYVWNSKALDWKNSWGADAWHQNGSKYYYAAFADTQPDLNFRNYEVRAEMKNVVKYWLNKGFDGLRIDAVRYLIETPDTLTDSELTHEWFQELRQEIDAYESPKFMVCEAWITDNRPELSKYFGTSEKPEFNMALDFDQGKSIIEQVRYHNTNITDSNGYKYNALYKFYTNTTSRIYGTFLGNHDEYYNRLGDYESVFSASGEKLCTALSLLRPTVPFIYYGNEIGQKSGNQSGDFKLRQPFDWYTATTQKSVENSILNVNNKILSLRKSEEYKDLFSNALIELLNLDMIYSDSREPWTSAIGYIISNNDKKLLIVANLTENLQNTLYFSDFGYTNYPNYSLLIGNQDTYTRMAKETYTNGASDILFYNFCPYEIRVYDLTSSSKSCVLDAWDFPLTTMYLRGSMNNWGYTKMTLSGNVFSKSINLAAGIKYEFKFDETTWWGHSYGPESSTAATVSLDTPLNVSDYPGIGTNFSFTATEAGSYTFTFNKETMQISVSKD